jgi:hypothetical protein
MMEKLTGAKLAHYVLLGAPLLRHLRDRGETMTYQEFARGIGLIEPGGKWAAQHWHQISKILYATAAIEKAAEVSELTDEDFGRLVSAGTGAPGAGFHRQATIVTTPPKKGPRNKSG